MSRSTPVDQATRERIVNEIDRSCLVEASAGTGKTSLMVDRIRMLLETGAARLDQLAAITFTEKAAGELRVRLRNRLTARRTEPGVDEVSRERLAEAVLLLDRASVTTIHAFCTQLLKERPIEAGVTPGFGVADEVQAGLLFDETWDAWIGAELARDSSPLESVLEIGASLDKLRDLALQMVRQRDLLVDLEAVVPAAAPGTADDPEASWTAFLGSALELDRRIDGLLAECRLPGVDDAHVRMVPGRAAVRRLAAQLSDEERPRYRALLEPVLPKIGNRGSKKNWAGESLAELRGLRKAIETTWKAWACAFRSGRTRAAVVGLAPFLAAFESAKTERNLLDFDDLLLRARDLLRDHPGVRKELRDTWTHLLVDEFQDTDPLQAEVVCLLVDSRTEDGPWEASRIGEGRLFLVGDPKQSIYRFRRADIEIYDGVARTLADSGGERFVIETNFRTRPAITAWVNTVFEQLMPVDKADAVHPPYSGIAPHRAEPDGGRPGVVRLDTGAPGDAEDKVLAPARRRAEARAVAAFLTGRLSEWPVLDRDPSIGWRPAGPGDVAILFRSFTALPQYEDVLRAAGIPYRVDGGKHYFRRVEVQALLAVLRAVDTPLDRTALVAALKSPLFGFSNDDLFLAAEAGALDYAGHARPPNAGLADAYERLRDWHRRRHVDGPSRIVEEIVATTRAIEFFSLTPIGEQRVANLMKILDEARRFERETGAFRAFIRHLSDREAELESEAESPIVEEESGGIVQLLSVHRAKGLEFPIVILADLPGGGRPGREACLVDRNGPEGLSVGFKLEGMSGTGYTPGWEALKQREATRSCAEAIRLFYVATTRARDLLVLPAAPGTKRAGGFYAILGEAALAELPVVEVDTGTLPREVPAFRAAGDFPDLEDAALGVAEVAAARREFEALRARRAAAWPSAPRWLTPSGGVETWEVVDVDAAATPFAAAPTNDESGGALPEASVVGDRASARRIGRVVHRALEGLADTGADARAAVAAAARGGELEDDAERERAERLVRAALTHPIWARAHASSRVMKETPFFRRLAPGVVIDGVCDLLFEEDGGIVVVDWKTDRAGDEPLAERAARHRRQLLGYAIGLEGLVPLPVTGLILVFLDDGATDVVRVDRALREEAARAFAGPGVSAG